MRDIFPRILLLLAPALLFRCASSNAVLAPPAVDGGGGPGAPDAAGTAFCESCELVEPGVKVALPAASELSGIAASRVHDGIFYVHNDSGDTARFFAIDESGAVRGTFELSGASADDWEDIAVGPCPSGSCIYLADTGDNDSRRPTYTIYRVAEPAATALDGSTSKVTADALTFKYPDGSHNSEAFFVHPKTGRLGIVTKVGDGASAIYTFPETLNVRAPMTLTKVGGALTLPSGSPRITGGDIAPDGRGVLLRTYSTVWFFPGSEGDSLDTMLSRPPCVSATALEAQGEAIGWLRNGSGYATVSEGQPTLHMARCSSAR